jgi:hypothetical protein
MRDLLTAQRPPVLIEILDESIGAELGRLIDGFSYELIHMTSKEAWSRRGACAR